MLHTGCIHLNSKDKSSVLYLAVRLPYSNIVIKVHRSLLFSLTSTGKLLKQNRLLGLHGWIVVCSILNIICVGEPARATKCFKIGSSRSPLADQKSCILGRNKLAIVAIGQMGKLGKLDYQ